MTDNGRRALLECSHTVMSLTMSKRIQENRNADKNLMSKLRVASELDDSEVKRLLNLHLDEIKTKHGPEKIREIQDKSIFLYYRNAPRIVKNIEMLKSLCTKTNPVAICKTISSGKQNGMAVKSHFEKAKSTDSDTPRSTLLCVGCKVALENKNYCPQWGLHNGALGTVEEIIYTNGKSPNHGHLPDYVVVHFPQYCGPPWDKNNPKVRTCWKKMLFSEQTTNIKETKSIPIPQTMYRCRYACCSRTYIPLEVSYARTIHKFQGLSAGPVDQGKTKNPFECIICDPDNKQYEATMLGLLYTAISRATMLGDSDGLNSAIYFTGREFKERRIRRLTYMKDSNQEFKLATQRQQWVNYLVNKEQKCQRYVYRILEKRTQTQQFIAHQRYTYDDIYHRLQQYKLALYNDSFTI